jgi:hypothetical protein
MSYKNYPTFDDINNTTLRVWNRCAMASNLLDDKGPVESQKYMEQFEEKDKKQMLVLFTYIKCKGYEKTKSEVMRGVDNGGE